MGLFGKKNRVNNPENAQLNELMDLALEFNQNTGTWSELPEEAPEDACHLVIDARKRVFEYIRQLKEAGYYANRAVEKYVFEVYPWMNKQNIKKFISLGQLL